MEPTTVFKDYMNKHCRYWTFNRKNLVECAESFLGSLLLFYFVYRYNGFNMNKIVSMFTKDNTFNDVLVHKFVCY